MSGRFTLAGLLLGVTLIALVLATLVPIVRYARRIETDADSVVSVGASADGSTFAALMGDGRVLFWDKHGSPKGSLQTGGSFGAELAISFDGKLAAVSPGQVWEVDTRRAWRSLPTSVSVVIFSPTEERIAVVTETQPAVVRERRFIQRQGFFPIPLYHVYTMDRDGPPRMISQGEAPAFSPDGQRLAVGGEGRGRNTIDVYDVGNGGLERSLAQPTCNNLAWAPDGQSLAGVFSSYTFGRKPSNVSIATCDLAGRAARGAVVPGEQPTPGGSSHRLVYVPDGQHLVVGAATRGFRAFDANTLQPVAAADMSKVWYVAAGVRGDTFIAAESHAVDLWDAATLRPRRRLFDAAPPPDPRLPICGLVVWVMTFAVRRRAKAVRSLQPAAKALGDAAPRGALS